ncbi:MAG: DUF58 domain-containing protein [Kofleriaceae bacterium]
MIQRWFRPDGRVRQIADGFPFTAGGLLVIAASLVAVVVYGLDHRDHVLLSVGVVGLVLVGVCTVLVVLGSLIAWRSSRRAGFEGPLVAECGHPTSTGFRLRSVRWLPFVDIAWSWREPSVEVLIRRVGGYVHEDVRPIHRDHFTTIIRRIEIRDPFGLVRIAFRIEQARAGRFAPWVGGLQKIQVAHGFASGDAMAHPDGSPVGDYYDMRRYGAGDPIRFVLWKVFARTRELLVRTPEISVAPDRRTIAYLVAGEGDEPAAGAARVAVDSGALGVTWELGADGCGEIASSREQALDVLAKSARARLEDAGDLRTFLGRVRSGATARAMVFVPARPGPWIERVAKVALTRGPASRVEFVVCTDGVGDRVRRSLWERAALAPAAGELGRAVHEDLMKVVDELSKTGANVIVVDRSTGRMVSARGLRAGASA